MALLGRRPEPDVTLDWDGREEEARERSRPAPGKVTRTVGMPSRISRFAMSVARRPSDQQLTKDLEDSTRGLTAAQRAALAPAAGIATAIHAKAVAPPPWAAIQADLGALDGKLQAAANGATSLARAKLEPAQAAGRSMADLVAGAQSKQSAVLGANKHLLVAREALALPVQPVELNGKKFSSRDDVEAVIAEARQNNGVAKGPVAGSVIQVGDEAAFRKKYMPLTLDEKMQLIACSSGIDAAMTQLAGPAPDLADVKNQLESMQANLRSFSSPGISDTNRASVDKAAAELAGAITVLLAQIAPLANILALVRTNAMEARTAIQTTVELPERPDPSDPASKAEPVKASRELLTKMGDAAEAPPVPVKVDRKASGTAGAAEDVFELIGRISGGQSLPGPVRAELEDGLGVDLGGVRIHTGADAVAATEAAAARAFAVGNDIYFSAGAFDPHSREGKRLLAHEIVHTVQQRGATGSAASGGISEPHDPAEREADAIADELVDGGGRAPELRSAPQVARQEEKKFKTAKDLDFPATSDPYALGQIRSCLNPKSPASAIIGGRGMHVAHGDMLALGFTFSGVSGNIRTYRHPDFPDHLYQIIIIDPAAPEADYEPPVDREVEERISEPDALREARRHAREYQRAARSAWPNSETLTRMRRQGQGDTPQYQQQIDDANRKYDTAQLWETAFHEKMPGWREALADDARSLKELEGLTGQVSETASLRGWLEDFDQNRSAADQEEAERQQKEAIENLKKLQEELENPPPPEEDEEEEPPPEEEEPEEEPAEEEPEAEE